LAHIHYRKLETGGFIVSPPNTVYVTTLPCKILITTLFMFIASNSRSINLIVTLSVFVKFHENDFKRIVPDECLFITTGRPSQVERLSL